MIDTEFKNCTIGDIAILKNGKSLHKSLYKSNGRYPVLGSNGPIGRTDKLLNEKQVIIIGRVGANCGSVSLSYEPSWVTDNAIIAIPKAEIDFLYLYYLLKFQNISHTSIGSAQPLITQSGIGILRVSIPSYAQQCVIGKILGSLDDKIALNREMNETLEGMGRAIFKSWFVDFEPVKAKAAGIDTGLPPEIDRLFPDRLEDSVLGPIPKGWKISSLSEIINIIGGGTPKTGISEYWDGDIPWFSVVDAPNDSDVFVIDTEKHISNIGIENSSTKILREGTTIISARGTVGKCALVGKPMAMNQSCYGIEGNEGYGDYFIYFTIKGSTGNFQKKSHGSVFNTITRDTFNYINILHPLVEITQVFDEIIKPFMIQILNNLKETKILSEIRDLLLPRLISGELRVKQIFE